MAVAALIDQEIADFMAGSVVSFLGTTDDRGTPEVARSTAAAAVGDRSIRLLVSTAASVTWSNLERRGRVAVLVTDITNYRSIQWLGRAVDVGERATPGDLALADHAMGVFAGACPLVGLDPALAWRLWPVDVRPVVVEVDEMFDQTPGPDAGRALAVSPQRP
jgi:Pyridoxamine 5'-phosphate oxidase